MSKKNQPTNAPQDLLDADEVLQAAADRFGQDDTDETKVELRQAALAFADAWRACEVKAAGR